MTWILLPDGKLSNIAVQYTLYENIRYFGLKLIGVAKKHHDQNEISGDSDKHASLGDLQDSLPARTVAQIIKLGLLVSGPTCLPASPAAGPHQDCMFNIIP